MGINFSYKYPQRVVMASGQVNIYYQYPIPVYNFTSVDNPYGITITGHNLLISTFPTVNPMFNRGLGLVGILDIQTSGITAITSLNLESNLRRTGVTISGSNLILGKV